MSLRELRDEDRGLEALWHLQGPAARGQVLSFSRCAAAGRNHGLFGTILSPDHFGVSITMRLKVPAVGLSFLISMDSKCPDR